MSEVTTLLDRWNRGDAEALKELICFAHGEFRQLAASLLRHERDDHTLQPTELVHEAYLRLTGLRDMPITSRRHFYGAAAAAMRRILVDHARHRAAEKRGGADASRLPLDAVFDVPIDLRVDFVRLDEALDALAVQAPEHARVVDLRYFVGLSIQDTADVVGVSPATIKRQWTFARAWLQRELSE